MTFPYGGPLTPTPSYFMSFDWTSSGQNRNGVFYEGDTVSLKANCAVSASSPRTGDFESGTASSTIAATDDGSAYAFSTVYGSPTYDATHAYGTLAMKCSTATAGVRWAYQPSIGEEYVRFYAYFTAYPTAVGGGLGNLCTNQVNGVSMLTDGKIKIHDSFADLGGRNDTTANAIPLNQWIRFEIHWIYRNDGTGTFDLKVFHDASSDTETERLTHTDWYTSHTGNLNDSVTFGMLQGTWPSALWMDNLASLGDDWWGQYSSSSTAITYAVRNIFGTVVSSGTVSLPGSVLRFTPQEPTGGWDPGWYRVYLSGPETDSLFGPSYGATNFCVLRDDSHFPPMPANTVSGGGFGESHDLVAKGVLGMGTSRLSVGDVANYTTAADTLATAVAGAGISSTYWANPGAPYEDSSRPRPLWTNFPNGTVDYVTLPSVSGTFARAYVKTPAVNGATTYVAMTAGTSSGRKIQVYSPDSNTLVETFDNLASGTAAETAINGTSSYIKVFSSGGAADSTQTVTAIGTAMRTGVSACVSALYAAGVTRFEGPINEPAGSARTAHEMMLFQDAVHAGHSSAKAIGPGFVNIYTSTVDPFLAAGGGNYCDEFSFHAYNAIVNGDLNVGRANLQALRDLLESYGHGTIPVWQTESTQAYTRYFGVYNPRRARHHMAQILLMEQYEIPRERNSPWYDKSHGFWAFPAWWENQDTSLEPQAVLHRVLAEETWGKPYASALDLGEPGNKMVLGSRYDGATESTIVLCATSFLDDCEVVLTISGDSSPTVADGFGVPVNATFSGRRLTVPLTDVPSYVTVDLAATVTPYAVNGFLCDDNTNVAVSGSTRELGGVSHTEIADDGWMTRYVGSRNGNGLVSSASNVPDTAVVLWNTPQTFNRVVIWAGPCWQDLTSPWAFTIDAYVSGSWTTIATVTKTDPFASTVTFQFGDDGRTSGAMYESYWDQQWVFDIAVTETTASGIRLNATRTSYGGEPTNWTNLLGYAIGVSGLSAESITLQEIGVFVSGVLDATDTDCFSYQGDDTVTVTYGGTVAFTYSGTAAFTYEGTDGFTYQGVPGFTYQGAPGFTYDGATGFTYQGTSAFTYDGTPAFTYQGTAGFTYGGTTGFTYQGEC